MGIPFIFAALGLLLGANALADGDFYFDAKTQRAFCGSKAKFSIRPVKGDRFLEQVEVKIDDEDYEEYKNIIQFSEEGMHRIWFRAKDPLGQWSPLQEYTINVDLTSPKSTPQWNGPYYNDSEDEKVFISQKTTLFVNAQDSLSGIKSVIWKDPEGKETPIPASLSFQKEGLYKIQVKAVDNVGNSEGWVPIVFTLDATAPTTSAELNAKTFQKDKTLYVTGGGLIALNAKDASSGVERVEYKINQGALIRYAEPISVVDRKFELSFRSVDLVGNEEPWKSLTVYQDVLPPTLELTTEGNHQKFGGRYFARPGFSISMQAKDTDSGLTEVLASLGGEKFTKTGEASQFKFEKAGTFELQVKARDAVGNEAHSNPMTIIVDQTPPETQIEPTGEVVEKNGQLLSKLPNQLQLVAKDIGGIGVDRIEYSFDDGKEFKEYSKPLDLSQWKNSEQNLQYRAIDRLGNREATQVLKITLLRDAPKVDLFIENSGSHSTVPLSSYLKGEKSQTVADAEETEEVEEEPKAKTEKPAATHVAKPEKTRSEKTHKATAVKEAPKKQARQPAKSDPKPVKKDTKKKQTPGKKKK